MNALTTIDQRRIQIASETPAFRKSELGQFMTPMNIANFMASLFSPLGNKVIHLLDPGSGIGSLAAAFALRAHYEKCKSLEAEIWEIDSSLQAPLIETLVECQNSFQESNIPFKFFIRTEDFVHANPDKTVTHAILNPPYKKISSNSEHRKALRQAGIETTNLYSAFVALALLNLKEGGELVAITPRSFCNGPYFKAFRKMILEHSALRRIHIFERRNHAFKGDDVLQENVIFHLTKGAVQGDVVISSSLDATFLDMNISTAPFSRVVMPNDPEKIFYLIAQDEDPLVEMGTRFYLRTLEDLGISVATGPVVDFRMRDCLRRDVEDGCVPLIYPFHFVDGFISHPKIDSKKPNGILDNEATRRWLMPAGDYVIVRRLTSKEEKRRIVPAVFDHTKFNVDRVGFENHLNVFHAKKHGLNPLVARGLAIYLGSTFADKWLRRFNGHTQVNAGDLRAMRYPDLETLMEWGLEVNDVLPSQEKIDALVEGKFNGQAR